MHVFKSLEIFYVNRDIEIDESIKRPHLFSYLN